MSVAGASVHHICQNHFARVRARGPQPLPLLHVGILGAHTSACGQACHDMTVWPSGLRRWLQAPVRKGVGSNPTAVTFVCARRDFLTHLRPQHAFHGAIAIARADALRRVSGGRLSLYMWMQFLGNRGAMIVAELVSALCQSGAGGAGAR